MRDRSTKPARVVLDVSFGDRLDELCREGIVWIVDSPINTPAAKRIWAAQSQPDAVNLTTFKAFAAADPEGLFLDNLETIDLHLEYPGSGDPYSSIEVIGCTVTPAIEDMLSELGLKITARTAQGFVAAKSLVP